MTDVPHSETKQQADIEPLYKHRDYLLQVAERTQTGIDKTLVTLACGALGVSLIVIKERAAATHADSSVPMPMFAWGALLVCLACSLFSMLSSGRLIQAEIASVDRMIREKAERVCHRRSRDLWAAATRWANRLALLSLLVGVLLVLVFASENLSIANAR